MTKMTEVSKCCFDANKILCELNMRYQTLNFFSDSFGTSSINMKDISDQIDTKLQNVLKEIKERDSHIKTLRHSFDSSKDLDLDKNTVSLLEAKITKLELFASQVLDYTYEIETHLQMWVESDTDEGTFDIVRHGEEEN